MNIVWKSIPGYEGFYEASNTGEIRSLCRYVNYNRGKRLIKGRVLKKIPDKDGYFKVDLSKYNVTKRFTVHRLVALTFIPNVDPKNNIVINHKDENKQNNNVENLEWCSIAYNTSYNNGIYKRAAKRRIPIIAIKGSEIKEFGSISEAENQLGLNHANIQGCLRNYYGRKTCGGYKFEYKELWNAKHNHK